jgi:ribosomal protein S18 acetylase RimI-like enzyme
MGTTAPAGTFRPIDMATDVEAIVALLTDINQHDQPGWFPSVAGLANDWSPTGTFKPDRDLQGLELDGRLIGIARHTWRERPAVVNHRLEVYVRPELRRQGHGTRLLDWAEARARSSVATGEGGPRCKAQQFGGGGLDSEPFRRFAGAKGYEPYRYHNEMRRPLADPIREARIADGLEIRPVRPEHHRAIWNADEEAFRDHWDHAEPVEGDFERFFNDPNIDTSLWQVAWDGDEVAGLVINSIIAIENEQTGELVGWLDSVATRRPWRGRGVASALIARSLAVLRERGMEIASLGVDVENPTGALGLYESFGFRPTRRWAFYRKPF